MSYPGKITRIWVRDFMTYNEIEVLPGSHLNFVIGANGTGKSTLVCAVLLGLGGKLKKLGRADELKSYIKNGCEKAVIEIDIQDRNSTLRIRREFDHNERSQYFINDSPATKTKVSEIRTKFNILIDNLCTFLPQERMHDFAKLNAQQLLDNTQEALGTDDLAKVHEQLKKIRSTILDTQEAMQKISDQLVSEKAKNNRLTDTVKTIREKQSLKNKITLINQKKAWLKYHDTMAKKNEIENDTELSKTNVSNKKKEYNKANEELSSYKVSVQHHQEEWMNAKKDESAKIAVVKDRLERQQAKVDHLYDISITMEKKLEQEGVKRTEILEKERNISKLKNDLKNICSENDASIDQQQRELKKTSEMLKEKERHLMRQRGQAEEEASRFQYQLRNQQRELRMLETKRSSRLELLKKHDPHLHEAISWLNENRHLFRGHIYMPILLEVLDSKMSKFVETIVGYQDLKSFICLNSDDMDLLITKLRNEKKLRINVATAPQDVAPRQPTVPLNRIRNLGFYSYLNECIEGPPPIIEHLCKLYQIHNIPIGDDSVVPNLQRVPNNIKQFFTSSRVYSVSVSSYSGARSTVSRDLARPRWFVSSIDENSFTNLQNTIQRYEGDLQRQQAEVNRIDNEVGKISSEIESINKKLREFATRVQEKSQISSRLAFAKQQLDKLRATLLHPDKIKEEWKRDRLACKKEINRMFIQSRKAQENLLIASERCFKASTTFKRFGLQLEHLEGVFKQASEALASAEAQHREMLQHLQTANARCKEVKKTAMEHTKGLSPGDQGFRTFERQFRSLKDTIEELDLELEEIRARDDFLDGGNIRLLEEYELREKRITELNEKLASTQTFIDEHQLQLNNLKDSWLNPIKELITHIDNNFGKYFASMGCAGEVSLLVPEIPDNFKDYGIKIRVKYRDDTPLEDLSRNYQSGGERAVATAIYMLSLQNLTSVPFRFVDEINQGMDPINERRITELIVRVTAKENASQYFFITPKLLPNVNCPDTMSVLCVYNGPSNSAISAQSWNQLLFKN